MSLLRVLQDGEIVPVGAETPRKVDVRVIAAANADFGAAIARGAFRRDLYYRLKGVSLVLPPLRDRREDIPLLVEHFCAQTGRQAVVVPEALRLLVEYGWPGNVRELHSVVRAAVLLSDTLEIQVRDLPAEIQEPEAQKGSTVARTEMLRLDVAERERIEGAMRASRGNVKQAAVALGIARSSLYRKLDKLGLARDWNWRQ